MSDANKALARRFYAAVSAGQFDSINDAIAENFVEHEKFPGLEPTREGVQKMFEMMRSAFQDFRMEIDDMIAEGDKVFLRARMCGTHKGEFLGIAPTGRQIDVPFADFVRIESGRVVEHWGITDTGAMMQQLGQGGEPA
ncbi:MAG: ester cyclase [Acidobacteria bacterium]|nr:ester cyclase [Acidobacteriota bacterium]